MLCAISCTCVKTVLVDLFISCINVLSTSTIVVNVLTCNSNQFVYINLTEMMESSTFKRFASSVDNILENLEDVDLTAADDDEIPQELLLGKQQLSELGSDSAKIKALGIFNKVRRVYYKHLMFYQACQFSMVTLTSSLWFTVFIK